MRTTAMLVLAGLALSLLVARSWRIDYPYSIDFQAYWLAGSRVNAGDTASLYAPGGGPGGGTPQALPAHEFKNVPLVALAFAPLARLDYLAAKRVFWWIGLAALVATAWVLGAGVVPESFGGPVARTAGALALLCAFAPAQTALRHGQTTPLVVLALAASMAAALRGRPALSGALLAVAAVIKLPVFALAALDGLRGRWRALVVFAATLGAFAIVSIALFGVGLHVQYLEGLALHAGTVMPGHNNQSLAAFAARLTGTAPVFDWSPRPIGAGAAVLTLVLTVALASFIAFGLFPGRGISGPLSSSSRADRRSLRSAASRSSISSGDSVSGPFSPPSIEPGADDSPLMPTSGGFLDIDTHEAQAELRTRRLLEIAAVLSFGIVALPVAWDHYFLMLAPAIVALAAALAARGLLFKPPVAATLIVATLALAVPTPQGVLDHAGSIGWPSAILLSHYLLGALLVIGLSVLGLRTSAIPRAEMEEIA